MLSSIDYKKQNRIVSNSINLKEVTFVLGGLATGRAVLVEGMVYGKGN